MRRPGVVLRHEGVGEDEELSCRDSHCGPRAVPAGTHHGDVAETRVWVDLVARRPRCGRPDVRPEPPHKDGLRR